MSDQIEKQPAFKDVSPRVNIDELEKSILDFWNNEKIFDKSLEQTKDGKLFTFYDGPPYATGKPHYGHILQSAIKDTVLRYKTMQGYHVPRRVGWDCHGLPVETLVEKELGFKTKKDIEQYGIANFNQKCRETVFRYINDFTSTLQRMGRWADYGNAYATLNRDYMESEWWTFKQMWDMDLVYKAFRSTPYCIRCATPLSNFEVTSNYKDRTDTAVYVLLKVAGQENLYLLVWTTTPWTLPANVAVAINPDLEYVSVDLEGKEVIVAKARLEAVLGKDVAVKKTWSDAELLQLTYEPLYTFTPIEGGYRLVASDHVTSEDGTGLVHMAPAFGEEDAEVGRREGLPVIKNVDTNGRYTEEVTSWAGQTVFEANQEVVEDLGKRGLLLKKEQYTHSYPYCWRCDNPLIYYALDTWFIRISELKERMLKDNEQINWTPEHVKSGRFAKGIESAPDWAVSRNRYWSVPIPVWECDACHERECVGSVKELAEKAGVDDIPDLHRPAVDEYTWKCNKCQGAMKRIDEVLDVWFDSGAMPYSQWHYPFERKEFVEKGFPADFIAESIEMTRAWFYVLHVLATALTTKDVGLGKDKPAFKNVIASGLIFAEDGQKLSKKLKNYPEPEPTIAKFGADTLRFYLLASTALGEPYRFSEKDLQQMQRQVYLTLWNVYSFFVRYANVRGWQPKAEHQSSTDILDRWILARLTQLENEVREAADGYRIDQAARLFVAYVDDLSNWYVRRSRGRFQPSAQNARDFEAAVSTLYEVLLRTAKLLAPYMPFVSEAMYRNLTNNGEVTQGSISVHLEQLGATQPLSDDDRKLLEQMAQAREIVSQVLALRAANKIKVRQPLQSAVVAGEALPEEIAALVRDEINVKELIASEALPVESNYIANDESSRLRLALDTELTPELQREGIAREIIRHGQELRRQAGYALNDQIVLLFQASDVELNNVLAEQQETIKRALQAAEIVTELSQADAEKDVTLNGYSAHVGVKR